MLESALLYASLGWPVFPLYPKSKNPATTHGFKDATTDEEQIRTWWSRRDYNIGIATGNGLCVLDVDDKPKNPVQGSDMLRDWEFENGHISETVTAISGTGGTHYYYDIGSTEVPSCQSDTIFIDIRCDGGYIVAPPSIHPETGQPYMWDVSPEDMKPAKATAKDKACIDWVYRNRRGADATTGRKEKPRVHEVKEGEGRNNYLFEMGCSARGQGSSDDVIAAYLHTLNRMSCKPPLDEHELNGVIASVCSKPVGMSEEAKEAQKRKAGRPAGSGFQHNKVGRRLINEFGACLIDGETPAIRMVNGRYRMGWDAFDTLLIDLYDDCKESNRREVKAYVKAQAPTREQASPFLVAFDNGVLDVRTMELRDYSRDDLIPNIIPHRWNPSAQSPVLDHMLGRLACGDLETELNLTEFIGMCMMRDVKMLPYFPVLIGEGSNGKSTYINLLEDVIGRENISGLQPKEIAAHFMGMHIVGKTANLGDDIAGGFLDEKDCSVIKSVATGDLLFTDVKGTKGFHFRPYCTMVFSCNQFPRLGDTSPGFMRRLFPIEFNARFSPQDADFDPLIGEKMKEEEVLERACVLGIEGLKRALAQNRPTPNAMSTAMKSEIASEGNSALQWFNDESITAEQILGRTKEEVYSEYLDWCERNGYRKYAMGSGTLSALIGTYFRLKCTRIDHREYANRRKTVKTYEYKVPTGASR